MNQVEIICVIVAAVSVIFGLCGIVFPKLTKKGVDANAILGKVDSGLEVAKNAVEAIKNIAPDTPYISTVEAIIEFADQGAKKAEQLYQSNQISAEARKAEAIQLTKDLLTAAGVMVTPQIETIIDGCVEAATYALPQTHTPENEARYAAHTSAQQGAQETAAQEETVPATEAPAEVPASAPETIAAAPAPVSIDDLNQAAGIINAAIAEKVAAAQAPTAAQSAPDEGGAVTPSTTGAA